MLLFLLGIKVISDYRPEPLKLKETPVVFGLLVKDIPNSLAESIAVGQDLFLDDYHVYLGKIYQKKIQPAEIMIESGGKLILTASPRNFDLRLEIKRNGRIVTGPSRSGVYFGKLPVRVGDRLRVHTMYTSFQGEIEYLRLQR